MQNNVSSKNFNVEHDFIYKVVVNEKVTLYAPKRAVLNCVKNTYDMAHMILTSMSRLILTAPF